MLYEGLNAQAERLTPRRYSPGGLGKRR